MKEHWFHSFQEFKLIFTEPTLAVLLSTILFYQPIYLDILPMYAIYIWLLPYALKYFQRGYQWPILAASFTLYAIGTFNLVSLFFKDFELTDQVNTGFFNLLSWQFIFILGLYLGFLSYQGKTSNILQHKKLFYGAIAMSAALFVLKFISRHSSTFPIDLSFWASKEDLGPLRLLNFFALLTVISYIAHNNKHWFTFKPLCFLGRYSLEVFAMHIMLVILFRPLKEYSNGFYVIKLTNHLYFYPLASLMLLFILIPLLFLVPVLKNSIKNKSLPKAAS